MRRVSLALFLISVLGALACSDAGSLTGPSSETFSRASLSGQDLLNTNGGTTNQPHLGVEGSTNN
jgi:hypothetical protein